MLILDVAQQSSSFVENRPHLGAGVNDAIKLLADHRVLPKTIIDVGCGAGRLSVGLACAYPNAKVRGIDLDPLAISFARRLAHLEVLDGRCSFECLDATNFDGSGLSYDLSCFFAVQGIYRDDAELAKTILDVTRPMGFCLVDVCWSYRLGDFYKVSKLCLDFERSVQSEGFEIIGTSDRRTSRNPSEELATFGRLESSAAEIAKIHDRTVDEIREAHRQLRKALEFNIDATEALTRLWLIRAPN